MEQQKFLKQADDTLDNVIHLASLIEQGDIDLSIEGLLRCFALLTKWYNYFEKEADVSLQMDDIPSLVDCEKNMALISSHIENFEDIFVDFEVEILSYFHVNGKNFSKQQREDALLFAQNAQKNENLAFKNWESLM